ncbi:MAG: 4Fe-4S dicluster domain-containing protein [Deltaproteobacteria bacterium]|nr:4Fe-4S dicluster domain-containing protein [Deltaproteobacteria bacterium]
MTEATIYINEKQLQFSDAVAAAGGIDVSFCYQCGKCASSCPVAYAMDLTPTQLMHAIQLGLKDIVYKSKTMWLCASCLTCSSRCPQKVDIAEVMDTIKILMQREKKKPRVPNVLKFEKTFVGNLKLFGRLHELSMAGILTLKTLNFRDMGMAIKMFRKGKFKIVPDFRDSWAMRRIFRRIKKQEKV